MKLSPAQQALHWRLWKQALQKLMPGRETWTKHEENEARHALYIQALGEEKSLTEMGNADFDLVLGALRAVIDPTDLSAQLHALNGQRARLLHGIKTTAVAIGGNRDYIDALIGKMNTEGKLGSSVLEDLHPRELVKVMIALGNQEDRSDAGLAKRGMIAAPAGQSFSQLARDRRLHHRLVGGPMPKANQPF